MARAPGKGGVLVCCSGLLRVTCEDDSLQARERLPIRERLAEARTRDEVVTILGRPRLIGYGLGFGAVALAAAVAIAYLAVAVTRGSQSAWVLAALPAPLFLLWFCGLVAYGF